MQVAIDICEGSGVGHCWIVRLAGSSTQSQCCPSARAGVAEGFEEDMLDITDAGRQPTSRLSCQIKMSAALDGIVVSVPQA